MYVPKRRHSALTVGATKILQKTGFVTYNRDISNPNGLKHLDCNLGFWWSYLQKIPSLLFSEYLLWWSS